MKKTNIWEVIKIDEISATPKYLQIVHSILKGIEAGKITLNERMPSINEVSFEADISRDTVEKSYKHLKNLGVMGSVPSKGYFIKKVDLDKTLKICLLFNKLSPHKKIIYDSFVAALGEQVAIDFYIYNNDFGLFKKLISSKNKSDYSHFVIIPHFWEQTEKVSEIINTIPKEKLVLLDKLVQGVNGEYAAVYENFEQDIYVALEKVLDKLSKYDTLKIIFPENSYFPEEILNGFYKFCQDYAFNYKIVHNISQEIIQKGEVYINLMEDDLVTLIKNILAQNLKVGQEVGVISYNETPLKEIILKGITTISTNFKAMGTTAAQLILQNSKQHIQNDFHVTLRNSL